MSEPLPSIVELMEVPEPARDMEWLRQSLQNAILLELATLPPYLCAYWSIETAGPVKDLVHSVLMEEMDHMGLACNMLTTIGGTPQLTGESVVPKYPGPLPGGVRPQLCVYLAGLSKDILVKVFMEIEHPENGPVAFFNGLCYPTIGAFYSAILQKFKKLPPGSITGKRQKQYGDVFPIKKKSDAEQAIHRIKEQGEGTSSSPKGPGGQMAHYYKFAEIWHGRELVQKNGKWVYDGKLISFPQVLPVAKAPEGGYPEVSLPFDKLYSKLLWQLEEVWKTEAGNMFQAIATMKALEAPALKIMKTPLPDGTGNYCPSFLWKPFP